MHQHAGPIRGCCVSEQAGFEPIGRRPTATKTYGDYDEDDHRQDDHG